MLSRIHKIDKTQNKTKHKIRFFCFPCRRELKSSIQKRNTTSCYKVLWFCQTSLVLACFSVVSKWIYFKHFEVNLTLTIFNISLVLWQYRSSKSIKLSSKTPQNTLNCFHFQTTENLAGWIQDSGHYATNVTIMCRNDELRRLFTNR